ALIIGRSCGAAYSFRNKVARLLLALARSAVCPHDRGAKIRHAAAGVIEGMMPLRSLVATCRRKCWGATSFALVLAALLVGVLPGGARRVFRPPRRGGCVPGARRSRLAGGPACGRSRLWPGAGPARRREPRRAPRRGGRPACAGDRLASRHGARRHSGNG